MLMYNIVWFKGYNTWVAEDPSIECCRAHAPLMEGYGAFPIERRNKT